MDVVILGQRELWHGILFEETNPNREPPKRPNWALCMSLVQEGKRAPVSEATHTESGNDYHRFHASPLLRSNAHMCSGGKVSCVGSYTEPN